MPGPFRVVLTAAPTLAQASQAVACHRRSPASTASWRRFRPARSPAPANGRPAPAPYPVHGTPFADTVAYTLRGTKTIEGVAKKKNGVVVVKERAVLTEDGKAVWVTYESFDSEGKCMLTTGSLSGSNGSNQGPEPSELRCLARRAFSDGRSGDVRQGHPTRRASGVASDHR